VLFATPPLETLMIPLRRLAGSYAAERDIALPAVKTLTVHPSTPSNVADPPEETVTEPDWPAEIPDIVVVVIRPPLDMSAVPPLNTLADTMPGVVPLLVAVTVSPVLSVIPESVVPEAT
jgi:hypothetical protein